MHESTEIRRNSIELDEVDIAYLECGSHGPLVMCVHGFPDTARTWRHTLPALAAAGYRVVAPWLRGYAPSGLSADGCYQVGAAVADVVDLHEALGGNDDAVVVGHDWGARIAGAAAAAEPGRWRRVVTMACPPYDVISAAMMEYQQLKRLWYPFFFLHPVSDVAVGLSDLAFLDGLWADWSPGYDATEDLKYVKEALAAPANLAAALEYYRATFAPEGRTAEKYERFEAAVMHVAPHPHLYLHGALDGCVDPVVTERVGSALPPGSTVEVIEGAGHFAHLEAPLHVNKVLVEFMKEVGE